MSYSLDFSAVVERLPELLLACLSTIGLAIAGMSLATIIGILGVIARRSTIRPLRAAVIALVEVIRNTPFLVQIFFILFAAGWMPFRRGRWRRGWRLACTRRRSSASSF